MGDRPKVGMADPATVRKALEADRKSSAVEARKGLYQSAPAKPAAAPKPAAKPAEGKPARGSVDMLRGASALLNRKRHLANALRAVGAE